MQTITARIQLLLILLMLLGFILLGQTWSLLYYQLGLVIMLSSSLAQIAMGNIAPSEKWGRALGLFILFSAITAAVFVISIWLAPILVGLGR